MSGQASQTPSPSGDSNKKVTVRHGISDREIPVGATVGEVREKYSTYLNIPAGAKAYIGNRELNDNDVITDDMGDQILEFMKKSGEKGSSVKISF